MRVVVKFHDTARASYLEWQARLSQPPTGNPGIARVHAEELIHQLQVHGGVPPGAEFRPELDPPAWVWRYSSDTWVRFVLRERRLRLWGGTILEVRVTGVMNQPPG